LRSNSRRTQWSFRRTAAVNAFINALGQGLKEGQEQLQKSQEEAERLADLGAVNSSGTSQQQAATVMTVTYSATMSHWQVSQTDSNGR